MGDSRLPGPMCQASRPLDIMDGTLSRCEFPAPGPTGVQAYSSDDLGVSSGRAYLFIIADEVLPSGKVIRKVLVAPDGITSQAYVKNPEVFGFKPRDPSARVSIGEHALGNNVSPCSSASTKAGGAPNFQGKPFYIDIEKAKAAGVRIYSTDEIIQDLKRLASEQPQLRYRVEKLLKVIKDVEGEVLLEGVVPPKAVKSPTSMNITRGLRVVQFVGIVFTVYDVAQAGRESVRTNSVKPLAAEGIRQIGGWGGAWVGMKLGGMAGVAVGIETGPGALLTGAAGAIIFGTAGYFGADWVAGWATN